MAAEWDETTVGEVCEVYDGPHATPKKTNYGPVFLGISSLNAGRLNLAESEHVSEDDFVKWTRRVTPRAGDLVFSYETRLGEAALIPEGLRCCLGRRMGLLRPRNGRVDAKFLLYYYLAPEFQEVIRQRTIHGSTVDRLALIEFPNFPVRLPPLPEQKAIAAVLGALDDKIELNRRMNTTLEAMARALFQSWFVDFDPVRANLSGVNAPGVDEFTASMFPAEFENTSLGPIPRGWNLLTLGELCKRSGGEVKTGPFGTMLNVREYRVAGTPAIAVRDIRQGYIEIDDRTPRLGPETVDRLSAYKVCEGDILFGRKGAVDRSSYVGSTEAGWLMGSDCIRLRLPAEFAPLIWSYGFRTKAQVSWIQQNATGTTMASLNQGILERIPMLVPPVQLLAQLLPSFDAIQKKLEASRAEMRLLANLRDTLLPKLLTGSVRIDQLPSSLL